MAVEITSVERDTWPAHVLVSVTGLTAGDVVTLYRSVAGVRTAVRGASEVTIADTTMVRVDAEYPFGTPVTWVAVVNGVDEYTTSPALTVTLVGGKVALTDALTGAAAEVVIWTQPDKHVERRSTVMSPGGRTVAVLGQLGGPSYTFEVFTDTDVGRENLFALLAGATGGTVLMRQPGGYADVDAYLAVVAATRRRLVQGGLDPRRIHTLDVVEVEAWGANVEARGYVYSDLEALFTGLDYADLEATYATYHDLAIADLSGA